MKYKILTRLDHKEEIQMPNHHGNDTLKSMMKLIVVVAEKRNLKNEVLRTKFGTNEEGD